MGMAVAGAGMGGRQSGRRVCGLVAVVEPVVDAETVEVEAEEAGPAV